MRSAHWMAATVLMMGTTGSAWALGDGLMLSDTTLWPRWQGRLSAELYSSPARADTSTEDTQGLKVGAGLFGDYYFALKYRNVGSASGFRATSGVLLGSRSSSLLSSVPAASFGGSAFYVDRRNVGILGTAPAANTADPVPYIGLGYTGLAGKGAWGFSADLGLMVLNPGSAVKLGRVFNGQSLDDALRDMHLSPVMQLGVSYSF